MNIFSKQSAIFEDLKSQISASSSLSLYHKFFQESVDAEGELPALITYVKTDFPVTQDDQSTLGNHNRIFHINVRILLPSTNSQSIETVADLVYDLVYQFCEPDARVLMVHNPSLTYQFEESNNYMVADLDIPILIKV